MHTVGMQQREPHVHVCTACRSIFPEILRFDGCPRQSVDYRLVPSLLQPIQQSLDLPYAQIQFSGSLALRDQLLLRLSALPAVSLCLSHQ